MKLTRTYIEDYSEVFRSHAEVYVFAEKYDIQSLKMLALRKLKGILAIFELFTERVDDVLSLLRYVYAETAPSKNREEDIRTMLMHYIVTEIGTLEKHDDFKQLLAEDSDMLSDFLSMLAQWIGWAIGISLTYLIIDWFPGSPPERHERRTESPLGRQRR